MDKPLDKPTELTITVHVNLDNETINVSADKETTYATMLNVLLYAYNAVVGSAQEVIDKRKNSMVH
jgi:hypothetical protein